MRSVDENVNIPIKWAFALLSFSGAGIVTTAACVLYVSNVDGRASEANRAATEAKQNINTEIEKLENIDRRLSHIEGTMERLLDEHNSRAY